MGRMGEEGRPGRAGAPVYRQPVDFAFSRNQYNTDKQLYSNKMLKHLIVKDSSRKCHLL